MKRLTQWCPANAQLSGNMDFTKLTAWRERSVKDGVAHSAQGAIGRCGLLKALDRHPVSQRIVYCRLSPNQDTPAMKETGRHQLFLQVRFVQRVRHVCRRAQPNRLQSTGRSSR